MNSENIASLLLRIGIAFSFLYAAIFSLINPTSWIGFLPKFAQSATILTTFSIIEIALAIWLISNKKIYYASITSSLLFFGMIIFNLGALDIIFRDITILLATIALAILSKHNL